MKKNKYKFIFLKIVFFFLMMHSFAQVTLEKEIKITDFGLHFNGSFESDRNVPDNGNPDAYSYVFGRNISAHGDAVKIYKNFVFLTWYKGGKLDRHMMLSRYNTITGTLVTIEFPHRHTGFQNRWWLGESHNTIAVGVSPLDGTIHLLFDMHAYSPSRPSDGSLANDYFRYSYSIKEAASLPDNEFTIDKFVKNSNGGYKHLRMPGTTAQSEFLALTYPKFFQNDEGDLLMYMREGGNNNGMYKFTKYDANTGTWSNFTDFNRLNAKSQSGITYNWGLYGDIKYVNGKIRIGFQRRSSNNNDKYLYQNGVYYAYSDDPTGKSEWKTHSGEPFSLPLFDADKIKIVEPGDYVATTGVSKVRIVGGFDWTVTNNEDVHIISEVKDLENNITKNLHTYKPAGASEFTTSEDFTGGEALYTSGSNVYLIGLKNGRVFVEKAAGGSNDFEKVYEATSGKSFDHGVVHIENGKAYYYLMEAKTGSAQPLYLQIIDLDIPLTDPTLPNNFSIKSVGETCVDMANGKLIVTAEATNDYVLRINGVEYTFNKDLTIENLLPGTYEFCIDVVGTNFSSCYTVTIEKAENLQAKVVVSKKVAVVTVASGTAPFVISKNGEKVLETYQSNFTIAIEHGDHIQIKSKEACQGEILKTVNLLDSVKAYPNPSKGKFELFLPYDIDVISLQLYDVQSRLLLSKTYNVTNGRVLIDIQDKPNGVYFVKMNVKNPVFIKLIKN